MTYAEWLPLVLDSDTMSKYRLTEGTFEYDANLNPTVSNVFSTATFRFGHSQIKQIVKVRYIISRAIPGQSKQSSRDLRCLGQSKIYRHCVEMRITDALFCLSNPISIQAFETSWPVPHSSDYQYELNVYQQFLRPEHEYKAFVPCYRFVVRSTERLFDINTYPPF